MCDGRQQMPAVGVESQRRARRHPAARRHGPAAAAGRRSATRPRSPQSAASDLTSIGATAAPSACGRCGRRRRRSRGEVRAGVAGCRSESPLMSSRNAAPSVDAAAGAGVSASACSATGVAGRRGTGTSMISVTIQTAMTPPAINDCSLAIPASRAAAPRARYWRAAERSVVTASMSSRASVKAIGAASAVRPSATRRRARVRASSRRSSRSSDGARGKPAAVDWASMSSRRVRSPSICDRDSVHQ